MTQLAFIEPDGYWRPVRRCDRRARALADRHYSRQTPGAVDFMGNGRGAIENLDPAGGRRWRCSIFRNESLILSSALIREATWRTRLFWRAHYGGLPRVPLTTEVDPARVLRKRDPGRCFRRAGWTDRGTVRGLVVLEAPAEEAA